MKFDIFLSICQTEVDGYMPSEKVMFENFFDQLKLADKLSFGVAWVAETHLSCQVQKENPGSVIPHFKGEIGLNTDILQLAMKAFSLTKRIHIGSAIMNILCNGGPIAHAEAIKTFLSLHGLEETEDRKIHVGFAAGRFPFSVTPYGIKARSKTEESAWPVIKGKIFQEATEIFLKAIRGDVFSSQDIKKKILISSDFRIEEDWQKTKSIYQEEFQSSSDVSEIEIPSFWQFDKVGVIPFHPRLDLLELIVGSHDPATQILANEILPVSVFNLSITDSAAIEAIHARMKKHYHADGGNWQRSNTPRTCMIFLNGDEDKTSEEQTESAKEMARLAHENYWKAMEGTLDLEKVKKAVANSIYGNPEEVAQKIKEKYHPEDRLMMWFDFNNHNNEEIKKSMQIFNDQCIPLLNG